MATKTAQIVREFAVSKDTPNAKQFKQDDEENGDRPVIGTIYVTKKGLTALGNSSRIRVTVEAIG